MARGPAAPTQPSEWAALEDEGRALWRALQRELGEEWEAGWVSFAQRPVVQWRPDTTAEPLSPPQS
jgi:hypothetical protein